MRKDGTPLTHRHIMFGRAYKGQPAGRVLLQRFVAGGGGGGLGRSSAAGGRDPPLDVTAIDNLPSLMPVESSEDFVAQLLPSLLTLGALDKGGWGRAKLEFDRHVAGV